MVELYHFWSSVCSVKVRMALDEKRVEWHSRYIDLFKFDQLQPAYLRINPDGVVPTLVHDGRPVFESSVINEYIDDAFDGPALSPTDPLKKARMRELIKASDDGFSAIVKLTMVKYIIPKLRNRWGDHALREHAKLRPTRFYQDLHARAVRDEIGPEELARDRETVNCLLDRLETCLQDGPWLIGTFSLADIAIAPYAFRLLALGHGEFWSRTKRTRVDDWYRRVSTRPAFQSAVSWPDESGGGYEEVGLSTPQLASPSP